MNDTELVGALHSLQLEIEREHDLPSWAAAVLTLVSVSATLAIMQILVILVSVPICGCLFPRQEEKAHLLAADLAKVGDSKGSAVAAEPEDSRYDMEV